MKIECFTFHITERTTLRLVPLLPDEPTFKDVKAVVANLANEDTAAVTPLSPRAKLLWLKENMPDLYEEMKAVRAAP